jgi:hypothetical protein
MSAHQNAIPANGIRGNRVLMGGFVVVGCLFTVLFGLCSFSAESRYASTLKVEEVVWWDDKPAKERWLSSLQALQKSEHLVLLSLHAEMHRWRKGDLVPEFEGYPVLGMVKLSNETTRSNLLRVLREDTGNSGAMGMCFKPRHGLYAVNGTNVTRMLICFECTQIRGRGPDGDIDVLLHPRGGEIFDAALKEAGVTLSRAAQ